MEPVSRARRNTAERSGGKIVRPRRAATVRSPYARPPKSPSPSRRRSNADADEESPNWLVGLVSPAAKVIVGAGKSISSFFFPDSSSSSPSSNSSPEDDGSDDDHNSTEGADRSDQNAATPDENRFSENEVQPRLQNSEGKLAVERLLMQETFSREECNKLVRILQSRTVEFPAAREGESSRHCEFPEITIGSNISQPGALQSDQYARNSPVTRSYLGNSHSSLSPRSTAHGSYTTDFGNKVVMEAKKWLEEKKIESYSQFAKGEGTFTSNSLMLPNVSEGEAGSPVLVAKSYMKTRPPWASPTLSYTGYQTSPVGMHPFKEETPCSFGANSLSSSMVTKRASIAVDSWNSLDVTRRVRFKSAEVSSEHIDPSVLHSQNRGGQNSEAEIRGVDMVAVSNDSQSLPVNARSPLFENLGASSDLPMRAGSETQEFSSNAAIPNSDRNQDLDDAQVTTGGRTTLVAHEPFDPKSSLEKQNGPANETAEVIASEPTVKPLLQERKHTLGSNSNGSLKVDETHLSITQPEGSHDNNSFEYHQFAGRKATDFTNDPNSAQENHSTQKEVDKSGDAVLTNGFPMSSSLYVELNAAAESILTEGNTKPVSSDGKLATGIPLEESCELLSEASVDIPENDDLEDSIASGSVENSSKHSDELKHAKRVRSSSRIEKQVAKKIGKYSRRSRGRGK